ncbi:olfactory receptor 11A1-like [Pleurodeles waltl]|uniref:olfactory receptor 11A1-like n=1 Tax=Pleurodeles waltl TaxID=8319 RepID=UPI0037096AB4
MISLTSKLCLENVTGVTEFLLLGFQMLPQLKPFLFIMFFTIYLLTVTGNLLIVVTVSTHAHLHSPMYFFLANLSFVEVWYTTSIVPPMLSGMLTGGIMISPSSCISQFHISGGLVTSECFLLTMMAYDRYVAICYPLHYAKLMGQSHCIMLTLSAWVAAFLLSSITSILLSMLQFSRNTFIDHFFCDFNSIVNAACSDTSVVEMEVFVVSSIISSVSLILIIVSYLYIIAAILRIPSERGRHRAFSTCSSHLAVVSTFFGTLIIIYVAPTNGQNLNINKAFSLLYTVATPLLNPIVYTLRNKDIRDALKKRSLRNVVFLKK